LETDNKKIVNLNSQIQKLDKDISALQKILDKLGISHNKTIKQSSFVSSLVAKFK
jgi:prefoldin subunit 5